jgi:hypothetical protein
MPAVGDPLGLARTGSPPARAAYRGLSDRALFAQEIGMFLQRLPPQLLHEKPAQEKRTAAISSRARIMNSGPR